jgi:hypothetical protein
LPPSSTGSSTSLLLPSPSPHMIRDTNASVLSPSHPLHQVNPVHPSKAMDVTSRVMHRVIPSPAMRTTMAEVHADILSHTHALRRDSRSVQRLLMHASASIFIQDSLTLAFHSEKYCSQFAGFCNAYITNDLPVISGSSPSHGHFRVKCILHHVVQHR